MPKNLQIILIIIIGLSVLFYGANTVKNIYIFSVQKNCQNMEVLKKMSGEDLSNCRLKNYISEDMLKEVLKEKIKQEIDDNQASQNSVQ